MYCPQSPWSFQRTREKCGRAWDLTSRDKCHDVTKERQSTTVDFQRGLRLKALAPYLPYTSTGALENMARPHAIFTIHHPIWALRIPGQLLLKKPGDEAIYVGVHLIEAGLSQHHEVCVELEAVSAVQLYRRINRKYLAIQCVSVTWLMRVRVDMAGGLGIHEGPESTQSHL